MTFLDTAYNLLEIPREEGGRDPDIGSELAESLSTLPLYCWSRRGARRI